MKTAQHDGHIQTLGFGGDESRPRPLGLGSQAEVSPPLGTESLLLEQPPTPQPVFWKFRFEDPGCILRTGKFR